MYVLLHTPPHQRVWSCTRHDLYGSRTHSIWPWNRRRTVGCKGVRQQPRSDVQGPYGIAPVRRISLFFWTHTSVGLSVAEGKTRSTRSWVDLDGLLLAHTAGVEGRPLLSPSTTNAMTPRGVVQVSGGYSTRRRGTWPGFNL